jgi:hypothetical protein
MPDLHFLVTEYEFDEKRHRQEMFLPFPETLPSLTCAGSFTSFTVKGHYSCNAGFYDLENSWKIKILYMYSSSDLFCAQLM